VCVGRANQREEVVLGGGLFQGTHIEVRKVDHLKLLITAEPVINLVKFDSVKL